MERIIYSVTVSVLRDGHPFCHEVIAIAASDDDEFEKKLAEEEEAMENGYAEAYGDDHDWFAQEIDARILS